MESCGRHVEELHFSGAANFTLLFRHAPKLRILRWGPLIRKQRQYQEIIISSFENFGSHPSLHKLRLIDLPGYSKCPHLRRIYASALASYFIFHNRFR